MIGICNGFQALVRMGLLPNPLEEREMTLRHNRQGHFINNWVDLNVLESKCVWTTELVNKKIKLPIRHGEGRIHFKGDLIQQQIQSDKLFFEKQIPLVYKDDVNGSFANIAGVCDPTGRILGMMPHPEAAISFWQNPSGSKKSEEAGMGLFLFESGIQYCEKNL
jgi:phosphoribosylformylglycinamidine (FGAM) synthase-like amidotransferase family enzyme